jgi:hypothetical protein
MPTATITLTPNCGPANPDGFAIHPEFRGFPPHSFVHIELLRSDGSVVFVSGVTMDANGESGTSGQPGYFGMYQPPGVYTYHAFVDDDHDWHHDPGEAEASETIAIPCQPCGQIEQVVAAVDRANLPHGTKQSLEVKLQSAFEACQAGEAGATCGPLGAFLHEVDAQRGKAIPIDVADALVIAVQNARAEFGCGRRRDGDKPH